MGHVVYYPGKMKLLRALCFILSLCFACLTKPKQADDAWQELYNNLCEYHHSTLGFAVIHAMCTLKDANLIQRLALTDFPQGHLDPSYFIRSHHFGRVITLQDDICQYWVPNEGVMLLDSVDALRDILPVMRSSSSLSSWSHWRYYMLPLLAQYIIPVFLCKKDLLIRELCVIRSIAPYIGAGFSFFFVRLNFALDCWNLTNNIQVEAFRKRLRNELVNKMGFRESVVFPSGTLELSVAAKDETFVFSVLKTASIWQLNMRQVARAMAPHSRLARAYLANPALVTLIANDPLDCLGLAACITRISPDTIDQLINAADTRAYCSGVTFHLSA